MQRNEILLIFMGSKTSLITNIHKTTLPSPREGCFMYAGDFRSTPEVTNKSVLIQRSTPEVCFTIVLEFRRSKTVQNRVVLLMAKLTFYVS